MASTRKAIAEFSVETERRPYCFVLVVGLRSPPADFHCQVLDYLDILFMQITFTGKMAATFTRSPLDTDTTISYLPLSHAAAQLFDIFIPIINGVTVYFAQPDALKVCSIVSVIRRDILRSYVIYYMQTSSESRWQYAMRVQDRLRLVTATEFVSSAYAIADVYWPQ